MPQCWTEITDLMIGKIHFHSHVVEGEVNVYNLNDCLNTSSLSSTLFEKMQWLVLSVPMEVSNQPWQKFILPTLNCV